MMALQNSAAISSLFHEQRETAKALTVSPNPAARILAGKIVVTIAAVFGQFRARPLNPESPPRENENPAPLLQALAGGHFMMALQNSAAISPLFHEQRETAKALTASPNPAVRILTGKTVVTTAASFGQFRARPLKNKNPAALLQEPAS